VRLYASVIGQAMLPRITIRVSDGRGGMLRRNDQYSGASTTENSSKTWGSQTDLELIH
jgi:hypothetical protein